MTKKPARVVGPRMASYYVVVFGDERTVCCCGDNVIAFVEKVEAQDVADEVDGMVVPLYTDPPWRPTKLRPSGGKRRG